MSNPATCRKVLILDDSPGVADTLALIFSSHGFEVAVAHSAEEAAERITGWEPDTAFVDIMLPGMNGIEFSDILRAKYPACMVLLMSGHPAAGELLEKERKTGREHSVLAKPLDPGRFLAIAQREQGPDDE